MRKFKKLFIDGNKLLSVICAVCFFALTVTLSLNANAATVNVWELDNWFSVEGGKSPDGKKTKIEVEVGDTITFTNKGGTDHDAVNDVVTLSSGTFFEGELFSGSPLPPGKTFTTPPFNEEGEIKFFCQIHGRDDMAGVIIVGGSVTTPTPMPTSTTPCASSALLNEGLDGEEHEGLGMLRIFRDNILANDLIGLQLITFYYKHSDEVTAILNADSGLKLKAKSVLKELVNIVSESGDNSSIGGVIKDSIPQWLDDSINSLIDEIAGRGSDELKEAIRKSRAALYE